MALNKILTTIFAILLYASIHAQEIVVKVSTHEGKPLPLVSVSLLHPIDSSSITTTAINVTGSYIFTDIKPGKYLVVASYTGFARKFTAVTVTDGAAKKSFLVDLQLTQLETDLKTVTVTGQKPMIEVKADKTIVNVEGTINATGSNALELLKKSPGIVVDNDDNIAMNGRNSVQVFIDGKASPLSTSDLANYLRSLQSTQIEAMELITNPSAKYDAAGNGGIINIKLKKNKNLGTNAAINQGYAVGKYGKYNGGVSINNRNKSTNIFANYNFSKATNFTDFFSDRTFGDTLFNLHSKRKTPETVHGFNTGIDFFLGKKNTIGILVNGNISNTKPENYSVTPIVYQPSGETTRLLVSDNKGIRQQGNVNFNGNYKFSDGKGKDLNIDADYGMFRNRNNQQQPNAYYNPSGTTLLGRSDYQFLSPSNIDIYSIKTDYENNIGKGKLGFGGKASVVSSDNHFERYDVLSSSKTLDVLRSNQFDYREHINAVYGNFNRAYVGMNMQLGLRLENTISEGKTYALLANGSVNASAFQSFKKRYTDLFPNVSFTFNKNKNSMWGIAYSRRIDRPRYDYLNPFEYKLDEYTFRKGNPNLVPQYSNTVTITNVYRTKLISKLSYGYIKNVFAQIIDTVDKSKNFITNKNLASQKIATLGLSYPISVKQYTGFFSLTGFYSQYKADLGGGSRIINLDVLACNFSMQNSLKLKHGVTAELSGNYNSPSIWQGSFKAKQTWNLDAGIQKIILKGQGSIKAVITDIFYTQNPVVSNSFAGQNSTTRLNNESRQFKLNFSYRFGNIQLKAARTRSTGSDDEIKRSKGGS